MSAKQLIFDAEARRQLKTGIDALANAVKVTLGPRGRNVAIDKKCRPRRSRWVILGEIELENRQNVGAQMLKQAATKTGDGGGWHDDGDRPAQTIVTEGLLRNRRAPTDAAEARHRRGYPGGSGRDQETVDSSRRAARH